MLYASNCINMKNETENTRSSWLGSPHHVKVWLKFSPLQMEPSIWDMEPGAQSVRCTLMTLMWQMHRKRISQFRPLSAMASMANPVGQWQPHVPILVNMTMNIYICVCILFRWIANLIYHDLPCLRNFVHVNLKTRHFAVQPVQPVQSSRDPCSKVQHENLHRPGQVFAASAAAGGRGPRELRSPKAKGAQNAAYS